MAKVREDAGRLDFSDWYAREARQYYNKIKVGAKTLKDDAFLNIDAVKAIKNGKPITKEMVNRAISRREVKTLRAISDYFFDKSGIYERLIKYMAHFYRYDIFVTPVQYKKQLPQDKVIEGWYRACYFLENSKLKKCFGEIAVKVIKNGCYYGYKIEQSDRAFLQELPVDYCRSRYNYNGKPAVEFCVKYFDDVFSDNEYRLRVVKMFPKEIRQAYVSYKKGTLPKDYNGDEQGWVLLDPRKTVKFNIDGSDVPMLINVIPHLLDLEDAQDLDMQKMMQQILKIIIQKFPLDKNNDLVFDLSEMQDFHDMAVNMLGDAIGVDVLSTLADVKVEDMADSGNVSMVDQLEKVERTVYNEAGVSTSIFNSDGSVALGYSVSSDEGSLAGLVAQFEEYAEDMILPLNKQIKKSLFYRVNILPTTIYNYKDMASLYREQTMLGFSKLLPQVALGMSQTVVIATALFENKMLKLDDVFTPPQMSSTMSSSDTKKDESEDEDVKDTEQQQVQPQTKDEGGRPALDDTEKTDKTIKNIESQ